MQVAIVSGNVRTLRLAPKLQDLGIRTQQCQTPADVLEAIELYGLDLVLIDEVFGGDVEAAIREVRAVHRTVPVVVVAHMPSREMSLACFSAGADDVVAWPSDPEIIGARIRAIVRRCRGADTAVLRIGPLSFDMIRRSLHIDGLPVALTCKEYDVLEYMVSRKGVVLTKESLLNQLYGCKDAPDGRIIDVFVCKLRKKLALFGVHELIETVRGLGYRLNEHRCRFTSQPAVYQAFTANAA